MRDTEYTYAVARIRANEVRLLSSQELNALISAQNYEEAIRRLNDKGYAIEGTDYSEALNCRLKNEWELILSLLPDKSQFDSIIIQNDFKNLKIALKALVCDKDPNGLFCVPSLYSPEELKMLVFARRNHELPPALQHCDRSAYRILTQTCFAQLADSVVDRAAMEWSLKLAEKADNPIMLEIAQAHAGVTNIKVLYRCILSQKAKSFMERCVCECEAYSKADIILAAEKGLEQFLDFVSHTKYSVLAEALNESVTAFERECDNILVNIIHKCKYESFGIAPLVAYYYAVKTEAMNVRIILSAKLNGLSENTVRERMRMLYV